MLSREHVLMQPRTKKFLTIAAIAASLLMLFMSCLVVVYLWLGPAAADRLQQSSWLQGLAFILGVVGAPSALGLWIAMLWYWASLDRGSRMSKLFWFLLLILANCIAAPFYCFIVYRRQAVA